MDAATTGRFCRHLCNPEQWKEVDTNGTGDLGMSHGDDRVRVSVVQARTGHGAVLRRIIPEVLSFDDIGLNRAIVTGLLRSTRGLMLVTGPPDPGSPRPRRRWWPGSSAIRTGTSSPSGIRSSSCTAARRVR